MKKATLLRGGKFSAVFVLFSFLIAIFLTFKLHPINSAQATGDTVDEIHYSFGDTNDAVVFDWHGTEQNIYYGLTASYGSQAVATNSAVHPVDLPNDTFKEVKISGLQAATTYHYKIGTNGIDHTFQTIPTGNFTWVDVGDTGSTLCDPWLAQTQSLIAAQTPNFVTHGGDISYANECGVPAVHQYYVDQQAWSVNAAFQPAWGNHEYGPVDDEAPPGTPANDSMANYKGRGYVTHPQTVPNDSATQLRNPGCGWETGASTNFCQGEDWGWFQAGHILFIAYPEPWLNAYLEPTNGWETKAAALMASAQADPNIDFIVTYGHRPAYSSLGSGVDTNLRTAITSLAQTYSPTASNPTGKYILNIAHHIHGQEVFGAINGLINITDGGGGVGQTSYDNPPDPNSLWRSRHPGILRGVYDTTQHSLTITLLCGPDYAPSPKDLCTYGAVQDPNAQNPSYTLFFQRPNGPTPTPTPTGQPTPTPTNTPIPTPTPTQTPGITQWIGNQSVETDMTGWTGIYNATSVNSRVSGGFDGLFSIRSINNTSATGTNGFIDKPHWLDGTAGKATLAGTTYTGSVWVKADVTGEKFTLFIRELTPGGAGVGGSSIPVVTAASTNWFNITGSYKAAASGNQIGFYVSATSVPANKGFNADEMSLTSPSTATPTPTSTPTSTPTPTNTPTPTPTPVPTFTVTGNVFTDANQNGFLDSGEENYAGATVALSAGANQTTTTTDSNGNYTFSNVTLGSYTVSLTLPNGYMATTTNPVSVALTTNTTVNFGIVTMPPTATPTPTNTPTPLPTATPTPTDTPTPTPTETPTPSDTPVPTATTTPSPTPTDTPTPTPVPTATLSGTVYVDTNQNGVQDPEETGYANATITLDTGATVTTDYNGNYILSNLPQGSYVETVTLPDGYTTTTTNPTTVVLSTDTAVNFGIVIAPTATPTAIPTDTPNPTETPVPTDTPTPTATPTNTPSPTPVPTYSITGTVFVDANSNGFQDSGESSYQNATVTLSGTDTQTVQTDVSGNYSINNLQAGNYQLTLTTPTGYTVTTNNPVIIPLTTNTTTNFGIALAPTATPTPTNTPTPTSTPTPTATPTPTETPTPSALQLIANLSVETNLNGWTGAYGASPFVTVTRDTTTAHTGSASIKVSALTGALNLSSGFNDNPRWVLNTTAGKVYTQSAWVKPTFVGQKINLRLREWHNTTLVTDKLITLTAANTNWQQMTQPLTAAATGNQLSFAIYASGLSVGQSFYADDFSLTSN